jgi:hypothetical protein
MFDLRDDGSIAIDFEIPPTDESGEPTTKQIVVKAPPTFGAYKRLRAQVETVNQPYQQLTAQIAAEQAEAKAAGVANPSTAVTVTVGQLNAATEDGAVAWWNFVMNGDDSFKGLAQEPPPADQDAWPVYLATAQSLTDAMTHWKSVPLVRGGKPVPTT